MNIADKRPLRLVVTGAESSGKSTLTRQLAEHFQCPCAFEYARIYLEEHGPDYTAEDVLLMSRKHQEHQQQNVPAHAPAGFYDTDLTNYKIWYEVAYGVCHPDILKREEAERHHVYLLCRPDLPWEYDPLREHEDQREMLYTFHEQELQRLGRRYEVIHGAGDVRLQRAVAAAMVLSDGAL